MVECLTRDRGLWFEPSPVSLRSGPWARHIYPSLVLVQPRKTCPCLTERLLIGRKESNQTKTNKTRTRSSQLSRPWWACYMYNKGKDHHLICCSLTEGLFVCLIWFFTSHQQSFSYKEMGLPGLNQYWARINILAQGHSAVMLVRLKPVTPRSRVKHSTTEPLRSHQKGCKYW